jgi:hypothetical protein
MQNSTLFQVGPDELAELVAAKLSEMEGKTVSSTLTKEQHSLLTMPRLTAGQAAHIIGVKKGTILGWIRDGKLSRHKNRGECLSTREVLKVAGLYRDLKGDFES